MNPFTDILTSTSTPATEPRSRRLAPPSEAGAGISEPNIIPYPDPGDSIAGENKEEEDELIVRIIELESQNLKLKRSKGLIDSSTLKQRITQLEQENASIEHGDYVFKTPENGKTYQLSASPNPERLSLHLEEKPYLEEPSWWNVKKRLESMSIGRYSTTTPRLSAVGPLELARNGSKGARPSEWRSSLESIQLRSSLLYEASGLSGELVDESKGNFAEYYTVGVDENILNGSTPPDVDIFQPAKVLHKFPDSASAPLIDNVAEFIFPGGKAPLYVLLDHDIKNSSLKVGGNFDQYQVMQFSDSSGKASYACCIIVTEYVTDPSTDLVRSLNDVQAKLLAVAIIIKFFRGIVVFKKARRNARQVQDPKMRRFSDFYSRRNRNETAAKSGGMLSSFADMVFGVRRKKDATSNMRSPEGSGIGTELSPSRFFGRKRISSNERLKEISFAAQMNEFMDDDSAVSETSSRSLSVSSEHALEHPFPPSPISLSTGKLSTGSSETNSQRSSGRFKRSNSLRRILSVGNDLSENSVEGAEKIKKGRHVVITQRSYCLISKSPTYAFLFKLLKEISAIYRSTGVKFENDVSVPSRYGLNVNSLLEVAQDVNLYKSFNGSKGFGVCSDSSDEMEENLLEHITFSYKCDKKAIYQFSSSLKSCTQTEFVLGALFSFLPYTILIDIINHLLLEKSLLICGKLASLVSIITTGIKYILTPLKWDGVFVPLLPTSAMEVLQAPVPFILGICSHLSLWISLNILCIGIPLYSSRIGESVHRVVESSGGGVAMLKLDGTQSDQILPTLSFGDGSEESSSRYHWAMSSCHEDELRYNLRYVRFLLFDNSLCCKSKFELNKVKLSADQPCLLSDSNRSLNVFMEHLLFHLNKKTKDTINRIYMLLRLRHHSILGDVLYTDTWKRYGLMDTCTGVTNCFR